MELLENATEIDNNSKHDLENEIPWISFALAQLVPLRGVLAAFEFFLYLGRKSSHKKSISKISEQYSRSAIGSDDNGRVRSKRSNGD